LLTNKHGQWGFDVVEWNERGVGLAISLEVSFTAIIKE
jgi:hypothetical protein